MSNSLKTSQPVSFLADSNPQGGRPLEAWDHDLRKFEELTVKGKSKVDEICRKATEVFSKKGYVNATLADVARGAGISKGGIYHYFSTKEELLFLILCRYMDQTLNELKQKLRRVDSPQEKIRTFVLHHIGHYRDNLHESRLILHEAHNLPAKYWFIIRDKEKAYVDLLKSAIENLHEDLNRDSTKVKLIVYSLIGMCNWPYMWYDPSGAVNPEELADQISRIFLHDFTQWGSRP